MTELPVVLLPVGSYRLLMPASALYRILDQPRIIRQQGVDGVSARQMFWPILTPRFTGAGQIADDRQHPMRVALVDSGDCCFALRLLGTPETRYLQQGQLRLRRDLVPGALASGAYDWGAETVLLPGLAAIRQALQIQSTK